MTNKKELDLINLDYIKGEILKNIANIEQYQEETEFMYVKGSSLYNERMDSLNEQLKLAQETNDIISYRIKTFFDKENVETEMPIKTTKKKK
jgi:hypothetical protein